MDNIEKIIRERHSVRNYLDKDIEEEKILVLNEMINKFNTANSLNIQLITDDKAVFDKFILSYGRLKNAKNYIALIGKNSDELEEKVGYYGEKLVLKAQELGLNTCWVAGTYKKNAVKAKIEKDEKLICVIAIGYGAVTGTNHKSKSYNDVSTTTDAPDWYKKGVEYALLAPTAVNQQKFKFEYLGDYNVKASAPKGHMTKVDLGIVKCHFELASDKKIE